MKKYAAGGELPQDLVDRLARESNKADEELIMAPARAAGNAAKVVGDAVKKNLEQGAKEHEAPKPRMNLGKLPGKSAAKQLGVENASDAELDAAAKYMRKGYSKEDVKDMYKQKAFKSGGSVSSASKRADGCATKGKTRGKMV
jgi:hypothetical protein